jgi:hypothetical protein
VEKIRAKVIGKNKYSYIISNLFNFIVADH